jgi:hypothetical protein
MSAHDEDNFPHLSYPIKVKVDSIKAAYVVSPYMVVTEQLQDLIQNTSGLEHALVKRHCSIYTLHQYCSKDEMFAVAIYDDSILAGAVRKLKGTDASNLYNVPTYLNEDMTLDLNPHDAIRNEYGNALLRMVSLAFRDRLELMKLKLFFLKVIFDFIKGNEELFVLHQYELMHHLLRLQDEVEGFSEQLPTVPPKVGNFDSHAEMLRVIADDVHGFMFGQVDVVIENLKAKATETADSKDTATGADASTGEVTATGTDTAIGTDGELAPSTSKRAKQDSANEDHVA